MSATMTMMLPAQNNIMSPTGAAAVTPTSTTKLSTIEESCCPNCGLSLPHPLSDPHAALVQAHRQIEDLQSQVRLLNQKAAAAVDRWADYEDELSRLRAASISTNTSIAAAAAGAHTRSNGRNRNSSGNSHSNSSSNNNNNRPHTPEPSVSTSSPRSSFLGASASRISQLLSPRKSALAASAAANATTTTVPAPVPVPAAATTAATTAAAATSISTTTLLSFDSSDTSSRNRTAAAAAVAETAAEMAAATRDLVSALADERRLRLAAEEKLAATNREVEDLSASLFEQANSMVATERRARAALEEQVGVLERRDVEKRARLETLEGAVRRIERARDVLLLLKEDPETAEEERRRRSQRQSQQENRVESLLGRSQKAAVENYLEDESGNGQGNGNGVEYANHQQHSIRIQPTRRGSKDGG